VSAALSFAALPAYSQQSPADYLQSKKIAALVDKAPTEPGIEGLYTLQEWRKDGQILKPPKVNGRFVLLNGSVVYNIYNRAQDAEQRTIMAFGSYTLDANKFSYHYEDTSIFTQTASGNTASYEPLWEGVRSFDVQREGGTVRFRSGKQEFLFTKDTLTYSEGGEVLRVWKRIVKQ
jgi:hypothetical protein